MVWFQCEDCGENLKKPKLPNHFRSCSATKLSCIDCGEIFTQQSVQSHTQCMTEAEKYGPKGQAKASNGTPAKPKSENKQNFDVDINVGLSSRPPWICSLCNTTTTSKQTLLLHAEGKKHRAKARVFHKANKESVNEAEESIQKETASVLGSQNGEIRKDDDVEKVDEPNGVFQQKETIISSSEVEKEIQSKQKRKLNASEREGNGEVIRAEKGSEGSQKKQKSTDTPAVDGQTKKKIKWKKLISSILKSDPENALKVKKLQKLVQKSLQESGVTHDEGEVSDTLMHKIESSSRFILDKKLVRLASS
ncbi:UBP1-associated proteins 1C-like [Aristolochia californica]|uniref:UBP1-associated proteins 1C-like n=1 Tax=Aristolochia californica TaxID=171875 RepID=UPI0035DC477A